MDVQARCGHVNACRFFMMAPHLFFVEESWRPITRRCDALAEFVAAQQREAALLGLSYFEGGRCTNWRQSRAAFDRSLDAGDAAAVSLLRALLDTSLLCQLLAHEAQAEAAGRPAGILAQAAALCCSSRGVQSDVDFVSSWQWPRVV